MRVQGVNIKVLTCWHFIRERYFMTTQEKQKKLSLRPLSPRDPEQPHRAATPLELLFDLIFVVAIATAGQQLHHAIIENHLWHALPSYLMVFFALWWAWMNFSWFASAYDNDDALYRCLTFVQIVGSLVMAAGIPDVFHSQDFDIIIVGYVIMRLALVTQWLRAAKHDPERRITAYRYAIGIVLVQIGWLVANFAHALSIPLFLLLVVVELFVPIYAEKYSPTPWHPHHIVERYALLTIIVLGESMVGSFNAIRDALAAQSINIPAVFLMIGGLMLMFAMWWAYFDRSEQHHHVKGVRPFVWGYGHYFVFVSVAAVGAALAAAVDVTTHHAHISDLYMGVIVAVSVVLYTSCIWILYEFQCLSGITKWFYPITALIILCIPFICNNVGYSVFAMGIVYTLRLFISNKFMQNIEPKQV
ncbi:low temperature requirement protein A [Acinetobacter baumannii]